MKTVLSRFVCIANVTGHVGNVTQWGEVKKKTKDRARSRVKDAPTNNTETVAIPSRGGRGRGGSDGFRGGRGRATDRGRGAARGSRGGISVNGNRQSERVASDIHHEATTTGLNESTSTGDTPNIASDQAGSTPETHNRAGATSPDTSWEMVTPVDSAPAPTPTIEASKASSKPDGTRSWASMFAKPIPTPLRPKVSSATTAPPAPEIIPQDLISPEVEKDVDLEEPGLPPPVSLEEPTVEDPPTPGSTGLPAPEEAINITPSKDELTETNLEQVLDASGPPPTATAASTVASTQDLRSVAGGTAPLHSSHGQHGGLRPGLGGFATSAYKATGGSGRSASFQRRVMEQQEAVVMPGNHAMDRAAVQFGSMGLNGTLEDLDVDDDREDAETRTQPPQHSPVAPRAALPPVAPQYAAETLPASRPAPGLPPVAPQGPSQQVQSVQQVDQALPAPSSQGSYPYHQFNNRFGTPTSQQDVTGPTQKAYEPFGQQIQQPTVQQHQFDAYPSHTQATSQQQPPAQSVLGTYSSAANDYPSYYTSDNQRNAYQNYYGNYSQPGQQTLPDAGATQQRAGSAFGSSGIEQPTQYATSQNQQPPQVRYSSAGDVHNSGHSTPNPVLGQGQISAPPSHQMPQQQSQGQAGGQPGAYQYGHPYYNSPYFYNQVSQHSYGRDRPAFDDVRRQYEDQYLTHNHQFGYGASQGSYGAGPYGAAGSKQGMYGQPHQGHGMSSQTTYDHHSTSPANVGGYSQREAASSGLGGYGRTGSAQPSESQQHNIGSAGAFGSMPEGFGRSQAGYSSQGQNVMQQQGGPQVGIDEASRAYGDASKIATGSSPAPGQASGRPGSATNTMQVQTGLPSSQGQPQPGFNNYPSQMNPQMYGQQPSQYGSGLAGLGAHHQAGGQSHQGSGYGGGYGGAFGGNFYGSNNRGGWGSNYGH